MDERLRELGPDSRPRDRATENPARGNAYSSELADTSQNTPREESAGNARDGDRSGTGLSNLNMEQLLVTLITELRSPKREKEDRKEVRSPSNTNSIIRPPKVEKLKTMGRSEIGEFLIRMKKLRARAAMAGAPISVTEWMSLGAIEFITAQGIDTSDDDPIMKYLEEHKTLLDRSHQTQALAKLRNVLKWPQDALTGEETLQRYLQKARDVVGFNQVTIKSAQKQMLRILVEKLPEYFVMTYSDFKEENPDVKDLMGFEEAMKKYISVKNVKIRERHKTKTARQKTHSTTAATKPEVSNRVKELEKMVAKLQAQLKPQGGGGRPNCDSTEHRLSTCPKTKCFNCNGYGHIARACPRAKTKRALEKQAEREKKMAAIPKVAKDPPAPVVADTKEKARSVSPVRSADFEDPDQIVVPNKAYTVTKGHLEFWKADKSSWTTSLGCLDSGSLVTTGSLELHGLRCLEITDIHTIPVFLADSETQVTTTKKGYIELRVRVDDGTPVYFGQVAIYLVPAPWKDFLIERAHLRRFSCRPEQVLQELTNEERTKYAGQRIEDEEHVPVKAAVARCAALGNADEHDKYEALYKRLGIPSSEPILFSNKGKDIFPDMDNIVGGDYEVVSEEELQNERKEGDETYPGQKADILAKIHEMVKQMKERNVFTMEFYSRMENLFTDHWTFFALPHSRIEISNLSEVECMLKKGTPLSLTVKARPVGARQEAWLRNKIRMMEAQGLIKKANTYNIQYATRIFKVPKKGPQQFRLVVNMKPLTKITVKSALQLPMLVNLINRTLGARLYGGFDIKSGYDQVRVNQDP
eukprot:augustus_masked-scaffold_2-processed-gene-22.46-mRNA-1 protein AED:1.00 eAED:1.00 QI:0/0/0/0/1/1/2/0/811